jgi:hypothetical protein
VDEVFEERSLQKFYKTSMEPDAKFYILDLSPKRGRPKKCDKIQFLPLYKCIRPITAAEHKDMMDLLHIYRQFIMIILKTFSTALQMSKNLWMMMKISL